MKLDAVEPTDISAALQADSSGLHPQVQRLGYPGRGGITRSRHLHHPLERIAFRGLGVRDRWRAQLQLQKQRRGQVGEAHCETEMRLSKSEGRAARLEN
jgi:hypothetical protein